MKRIIVLLIWLAATAGMVSAAALPSTLQQAVFDDGKIECDSFSPSDAIYTPAHRILKAIKRYVDNASKKSPTSPLQIPSHLSAALYGIKTSSDHRIGSIKCLFIFFNTNVIQRLELDPQILQSNDDTYNQFVQLLELTTEIATTIATMEKNRYTNSDMITYINHQKAGLKIRLRTAIFYDRDAAAADEPLPPVAVTPRVNQAVPQDEEPSHFTDAFVVPDDVAYSFSPKDLIKYVPGYGIARRVAGATYGTACAAAEYALVTAMQGLSLAGELADSALTCPLSGDCWCCEWQRDMEAAAHQEEDDGYGSMDEID